TPKEARIRGASASDMKELDERMEARNQAAFHEVSFCQHFYILTQRMLYAKARLPEVEMVLHKDDIRDLKIVLARRYQLAYGEEWIRETIDIGAVIQPEEVDGKDLTRGALHVISRVEDKSLRAI